MNAAPAYDLILQGGHVICPASGLDGVMDVAIADGRIAAVRKDILPSSARKVIDAKGKLVIPGMIDTHAHVYKYVTGRFGLDADMCGVDSGVTTLIDQGGPSSMTLPGFRHFIVEPAKSRVVCFISAYLAGGMEGHYYPELYAPNLQDPAATVKAAKENADIVKGVKGHAEIGGFARYGTKVIEQSAQIAREAGIPLYVHFGQLWGLPKEGASVDPDTVIETVVKLLKPGDILAHPFTRHPGGFVDKDGKVHPIVRKALDMGLKTDVGHGSHFSYRLARIAIAAGIIPDTLGADMHGYNTHVPAPKGTPGGDHPDDENHPFAGQAKFSLTQAMTSMLALGIDLKHVVEMVTVNAAKMIRLENEIGTLKPGVVADVSVLDDLRGKFKLVDNEKTEVVTERLLQPAFCLRAGVRFDATAPILPKAMSA